MLKELLCFLPGSLILLTITGINPLMLKEICLKFLSESMILLIITFEFTKILQNIWRRVVNIILNNIPPSNIFLTWLLPVRFYQNRQAVLAAVSINGLRCFYKIVSEELLVMLRFTFNLQIFSHVCFPSKIVRLFLAFMGINGLKVGSPVILDLLQVCDNWLFP